MLEINNTFLLAGLIIVAVTCIYLLYVSFNRPDMTSFKNNLNNIVQQNKKRDEIVNFLLDKVQGLNKLVTSLQNQCQSCVTSENGGVDQQSVVMDNADIVSPKNVDDLMEQLNEGLIQESNVEQLSPEDLQLLEEMTIRSEDVNNTDELQVLEESEFINMKVSEFDTVMNIVQNENGREDVGDIIPDDFQEHDEELEELDEELDEEVAKEVVNDIVDNVIVDNVMEELEESGLSIEDESYLKSLPQKKEEFADTYNVKDLREICKRFNLGTYGRKVEIAERILKLL